MPFLAWSRRLARKLHVPSLGLSTPVSRWWLRHQAWLYFPLLAVARLTWSLQSAAYAFQMTALYWGAQDDAKPAADPVKAAAAAAAASGNVVVISDVRLRHPMLEKLSVVAHWSWYLALIALTMTPLSAAVFILASQGVAGFLMALAFGVGHNGMEVFDADKRPGFAELQVRTTRDVVDTPFNAFITGGLHYQIEHHLFPTMPRHNLGSVAPAVRELCAKHGVPYRCRGLLEGNAEVLAHLADVAADMVRHGPM